MTQLDSIRKCFGNLYCNIENDKCIGRDTVGKEKLLESLYIAYWISCNDENCDITCFVKKYCASCLPLGNVWPTPDPNEDCCITGYASGAANVSFEKGQGVWEVGFSLPTGDDSNIAFSEYKYDVEFWQDGSLVDFYEQDGLDAATSLSLPFKGDGVYYIVVQYLYGDPVAGGFTIAKIIEVKGNAISKYAQIDSTVIDSFDCKVVNLSGTYSASSNVTVYRDLWLEQLAGASADLVAGFGPTLSNYVITEINPSVLAYVILLDPDQWPDYDFGGTPSLFSLLLMSTSCTSSPLLTLVVDYDCETGGTATSTITYQNVPDGTSINFEYSSDGGVTWHTLDNEIVTDGSGEQTNDNLIGLADGSYVCRARSDDSSIISNYFDLTVNCD